MKTQIYHNRKTASKKYRKKPAKYKGILRWIFLFILVILFFVFFTGNKSLFKLYSLQQTENKLLKERQELLEENEELTEEIHKLKKDQKYIEKVAREKHNMKKKDEDIYIIDSK